MRVAIDESLQYYRLQQAMASADEHLLISDQEDVLYVVKRSSVAFRAIAYVSK